MQHKQQLLSSFHSKRRNDHLPLAFQCIRQHLTNALVGARRKLMLTASVSAFHQQEINILHRNRIAQQLVLTAAHITGKQKPLFPARRKLVDIENYLSRSQNVTGIHKLKCYPICNRKLALVVNVHELAQATLGIFLGIDRSIGRLALLLSLAIHIFYVALLNSRTVSKHDLTQVPGRKSRVNIPRESLVTKIRKIAAVINVRMRQYDSVDFRRRKVTKLLVPLILMRPLNTFEQLIPNSVEHDPFFGK